MKQRKIYLLCTVLLTAVLAVTSCKKDNIYLHSKPVDSYSGSVYDYLASQPNNFENMLKVLQMAGLTDVLKQDSVTFFAPTDQSLKAAMDKYNIFRKKMGLSDASFEDIDSTSWRSILTPYIIHGELKLEDFSGQDGLMMASMALRPMHGRLIKNNASGAAGLGTETIEFSYTNGSRFESKWLPAYVSTSNIEANNGIINILENRHVLGFNFFINKAKEPQNPYAENTTFATGEVKNPNGRLTLWSYYFKTLTAVNDNTVQTEAAINGSDGYIMLLTVHSNDSVTVSSAPSSANSTIKNSGPCFFDKENYQFVLNYSFTEDDGEHLVNEIIRYIAIRQQ